MPQNAAKRCKTPQKPTRTTFRTQAVSNTKRHKPDETERRLYSSSIPIRHATSDVIRRKPTESRSSLDIGDWDFLGLWSFDIGPSHRSDDLASTRQDLPQSGLRNITAICQRAARPVQICCRGVKIEQPVPNDFGTRPENNFRAPLFTPNPFGAATGLARRKAQATNASDFITRYFPLSKCLLSATHFCNAFLILGHSAFRTGKTFPKMRAIHLTKPGRSPPRTFYRFWTKKGHDTESRLRRESLDSVQGFSTEEQRSQAAFGEKTLRAAGLLPVACVGSFLTAHFGDARNSPPWSQPKFPAAGPLVVSNQALNNLLIHVRTHDQ
jgi:hypothetical protein